MTEASPRPVDAAAMCWLSSPSSLSGATKKLKFYYLIFINLILNGHK